ncbi:MAG: hypothetical protein RL091_2283 [Verrucomicrobiota bacterium]|jgi:hypothetical protein
MLTLTRWWTGPTGPLLALRLILCIGSPLLAAEAARKPFAIPAAAAEVTLGTFSDQAGAQVVYLIEDVRGAVTNPVQGDFAIREALERLVDDTGLRVVQDEKTGAFVIKRDRHARPPTKTARNQHTAPPKTMNSPKPRSWLVSLFALLAATDPLSAQTATPDATSKEETLVLSPFVVGANDSVGYSANSTLAGTRINTALRDVGASISIITPEFLSDTASTNLGELLSLTTATEVGGIGGNFAGGGQDSGRSDQSDARENPEGNQRVRGIGPATLTRDFFLTDIPFDSYNTSGVTISRGPNSLLFGIGNPAGIIEASLIKAQLGRNRTEIAVRYGSNNSYRSTLDLNRMLVKNRLAFRIASVGEQNNFDQTPAFDRKRRLYGTVEAVLREGERSSVIGKAALRVSGEVGDLRSNPVNVIPPVNAFSIFFQPPDPALDNIPGVDLNSTVKVGGPGFIWAPRVTIDNRVSSTSIPQNVGGYYAVPYFIQIPLVYDTPGQVEPGYANSANPALAGIAGVMPRVRYSLAANGRLPVDLISTQSVYASVPGFVSPSLQDRNIFDYRNHLLAGDSSRIKQGFHAVNMAFTQELFARRGGFEVAYDRQHLRSERELPFSFGSSGAGNGLGDIYLDVSQFLSNDQPNPDLGRPFILQAGSQQRVRIWDRDSFRATGFYRLDLEDRRKTFFGIPLGNHIFTGLFSTQKIDNRTESYQVGWDSATRDLATDVFQQNLAGFRRIPIMVQYVGPSVLTAGSMGDVRITTPFAGQIPRDGDTHNVTFFNFTTKQLATDTLSIRRYLSAGSLSRQEITSKSLSMKSEFFADTIITVFGWRWDELHTFSNVIAPRLPDGGVDPDLRLRPSADLVESGRNFTWSVVGRYPEKLLGELPFGIDLGAYYNSSGNFNPIAVRTDLSGQTIPAPAGDTKEYGLLIELFERRASLRLNWFKTRQSNASNNAQGATQWVFDFPSFLIDRYRAAETQGIAFSGIPGVTAAGYSSYQQLYSSLFQLLPEPTKGLKNLRFDAGGNLQSNPFPGLTDTSNLNARGFEAELIGNLTKRWRVSFNVARQETVVTGSASLTKQVADALQANLAKFNLLNIDQGPALPERQTVATRFNQLIGAPLAATVAREGAVSGEQREWRANFVTTYDLSAFNLPVVKNMGIGTAIRWQSKIVIGYPFLTGQRLKEKIVATDPNFTDISQIADTDPIMQSQFPDLAHPFQGPEELAGDVWISYRRRISKNIDWRLQLNVRNAWGNDKDIPVAANPDGTIAVIRIPNETSWYLSSMFSF